MLSRESSSKVLRALFLLCALAINFSAVAQNRPPAISGNYDNELMIGVDEKSGLLTGYFETGTGWDESTKSPRFVCAFFIYGKSQADAYQITAWHPDGMEATIKGRLKFLTVGGVAKAHIKLDELPGGCGMANPSLAQDAGSELSLSIPARWTSVRAVSAKSAFFHRAPNPRAKEKAYVVRGDAVRVFKVQPGWVEAEFATDTGKKVRGWLKESDLFDLNPK
ncbi:MAG: hypothetical protein WCF57_11805 [Pyrinomonadaceae bacterium]